MATTVDLCDLFNKYGTNKDRNGYSQVYHTLFFDKHEKPLVLLEIGIGTMISGVQSSMVGCALEGYKPGGSLRAWRDFFINGRIIGVDIQPDTQFSDEHHIETYICNSTILSDVNEFMAKLEGLKSYPQDSHIRGSNNNDKLKFDIIIDNGSHHDIDQIHTLRNFYPYLKNNGIYVIEDIYPGSKVTEFPTLVGCVCNQDPYFFAGLKNNMCVIYKNKINTKRLNY